MNLFTRNSPYYHLLKYLLFLFKHPVCMKSRISYLQYFDKSKHTDYRHCCCVMAMAVLDAQRNIVEIIKFRGLT